MRCRHALYCNATLAPKLAPLGALKYQLHTHAPSRLSVDHALQSSFPHTEGQELTPRDVLSRLLNFCRTISHITFVLCTPARILGDGSLLASKLVLLRTQQVVLPFGGSCCIRCFTVCLFRTSPNQCQTCVLYTSLSTMPLAGTRTSMALGMNKGLARSLAKTIPLLVWRPAENMLPRGAPTSFDAPQRAT